VNLGSSEAPEGIDAPLGAKVEWAVDEAFVLGYRVAILAPTTLASAISAALLIEDKKPKRVPTGHRGPG
jgi:hypothetical protein